MADLRNETWTCISAKMCVESPEALLIGMGKQILYNLNNSL